MPEKSPQYAFSKQNTDRSGLALLFRWILFGYGTLLVTMLIALASYTTPTAIGEVLTRPEIFASVRLTLFSATSATIAGVIFGIPVAYQMSRGHVAGKWFFDAVLDIPLVMPPLVLGLSLLVLFQFYPADLIASWIVYQIPAVFIAQFMVAVSYTIPVLRAGFDSRDGRDEHVAAALGCSPVQTFLRVTIPENRPAMIHAGAMAWARCTGTFGPLLVFAGATRRKTEVLATTIYLEQSSGDLKAAVAVSLLLVFIAGFVLLMVRKLVQPIT